MNSDSDDNEPLPMAAPCRQIAWDEPLQWLRLGFADLRKAPVPSLFYGLIMVLVCYVITAAAWYTGRIGIYLGIMSGFVFLGPVLALRLYAISKRLGQQQAVSIRSSFRDARDAFGDVMVYGLILLIVVLIWARAATMVHIFFPTGGSNSVTEWIGFLAIGSVIGAMFCAIIFMTSAFSLPMMLDRRCDTVTAVVSSVNASLRNMPAMICWACCIAFSVLIGVATAYIGFVVLLPVLGHATWHGYKATLDTRQWPDRQ